MRVRLLCDGGYSDLLGVEFPIDVEAVETRDPYGVEVTLSEMSAVSKRELFREVYYFTPDEFSIVVPALYLEQLHPDATLPARATQHSAAMDVSACLPDGASVTVYGSWAAGSSEQRVVTADSPLTLMPGERALVPTGWKMCCDPGYCIKLYPRSGLSVKRGLSLINAVGVVDADYRGEVCVTLVNLDSAPQVIEHGDRLCQMMLERVEPCELVVGKLPDTDSDRNGGFGSTGV